MAKTSFHLRAVAAALTGGAAIVATLAWRADLPAASPVAAMRSPGLPAAAAAAQVQSAPATPGDRLPAAVDEQGSAPGRPVGVSAQAWAALTAELRQRPDGLAELRRLAGHFEWSDALQRLRTARTAGAAATELLPLARSVDDGLPERMRRAEVSAAEARQIKSVIFELTVPDESERAQRLQQWSAATFATTAPDPRQAVFEQRQSDIVAAWSAQPAPARDGAALERQLEALRQQTFSSGAR